MTVASSWSNRRPAAAATLVAVVLAVWVASAGITVTRSTVFVGLMTGAMTGLLSVGLVLVYRSTKVINFAYGEVGIFGASLLSILVLDHGWNYWLSLVLAIAAGAVLSMAIEMTVVRRLFEAPRVILFAATLGVSQLVLVATLELPDVQAGTFPTPFFVQPTRSNPEAIYSVFGLDVPFELFGVQVLGRDVMVLAFVPLVVLALTWFMGKTLYGLCVRASASNADAARLAGVSPRKMSTVVWAIAGGVAVLTATLLLPVLGAAPGPQSRILGPTILLRALAGALAGRMQSMPKAMAGGLVLGVVEEVIRFNTDSERLLLNNPGFAFMVLFVAVLGLVLWHSRHGAFGLRDRAFSFSPRTRPAPPVLLERLWVRRLPRIIAGVALAVALVAPIVLNRPSKLIILSTALLWAVIALSVTVMTGWGGQLSLGQYALVGIGGMTTATLTARGIPWGGGRWFGDGLAFVPAVGLATVVTIVVAMLIGAPALRVRGLFLAVTTFAFAVACEFWLLDQPLFVEEGQSSVFVPRAHLGPLDLGSERTYYYLCLAVLVVAASAVARLRRGGVGRTLIAVRDNEPTAQAFSVSPTRAKFIAFGVGGALTGVAGGLLVGLQQNADPAQFTVTQSLNVVSVAIVGGVGTVAGPIIGAMWVQATPAILSFTDEVNLLRSGIGLLVMLMYFPGGLVQIGFAARDAVFDVVARRAGPQDTSRTVSAAIPTRVRSARSSPADGGGVALRTEDVTVRFGGSVAVDHVSLTAADGEVVGLIGGNGAGKSTLMNAIGGFVPSEGRVHILGRDVSELAPHRRARTGLGRTFQAADLFGDLTVLETVQVALEARESASLTGALLALPAERSVERRKRAEATELVDFVGLGRYANAFINELSTGTRRICELACLLAVDARVLCLDEPTAGVAQRETEAFGPLIKRIQAELGATLIVIEHDMPLIMSISDRVYCLEAGKLIAEGPPDAVRNNPLVIASYLGTDVRAIERSGTRST